MGFRDLEKSNLALLAKQLWTLHSYLNSLLAQTLKSKYFPDSNIWETPLGYNSSFAWRSIWSARSLLEKGTRWRIGNGSSIKIWKDAWRGGFGSGKIISPPQVISPEAYVCDLFDPASRCWNLELISNIFLPFDVDRILKVPISAEDKHDERVWIGNDEGVFKVKDAYRSAMMAEDRPSCSKGTNSIWKQLWSLNIPPKARMFL